MSSKQPFILLFLVSMGLWIPNSVEGHNFLMINSTVNNSYGPISGNLVELNVDDPESLSKLVNYDFVRAVLRISHMDDQTGRHEERPMHDGQTENRRVAVETTGEDSVRPETGNRPPIIELSPHAVNVEQDTLHYRFDNPAQEPNRDDRGSRATTPGPERIENEEKRSRMMFNAGDISLLEELMRVCLKTPRDFVDYFSQKKIESILIKLNSKVLANLYPVEGDPKFEK